MDKGRGKGKDTLQTNNVFTRKEYIEREAVYDALSGMDYYTPTDATRAISAVRAILAADVVPIRHGKWVGHDIGGRISIDNDACSECGSVFYQIAETGCVWNYCPNCGARMDGDGDA